MTSSPIALDDSAIADLTEDAINAIALIVQKRLGITDGGPASMFYSDKEERGRVEDCVRAYLAFEERGLAADAAEPEG